jgi:hypothetical protein
MVSRSMTLMKPDDYANRLAAVGSDSVGRGQGDGFFGQHGGQAGEHVGEVFLWAVMPRTALKPSPSLQSAVWDESLTGGKAKLGPFGRVDWTYRLW